MILVQHTISSKTYRTIIKMLKAAKLLTTIAFGSDYCFSILIYARGLHEILMENIVKIRTFERIS